MDEKVMAERILKKLCPFCESDDISIDWIGRKAICRDCGKSMRKEEGERILRRAEVNI